MADSATGESKADTSSVSHHANSAWPPPWLPPVAILAVALVWPMIGYGASHAWQNVRNRVADWLPESFPETKSLTAFFDRFGSDEFLMISWQDCVLGDARAENLESLLLKPAGDGKVYFAKADCGRKVLDSLIANQKISEAEAKRRLTGLFVGADGQQSCVIALISQSGFDDRRAAVNWAWEATKSATGLDVEDIHVAGITADSVAVDEASNANLLELNVLSSIICFVILVVALRNLWLVGTIFLTAMLNQHLALAVIYFSGGHIDSVQLLVANLCFVLTISAGLHFLGYFRTAVRSNSRSPSIEAVRHALIPTLLAAGTTSLGFISLCMSELVPIRSFGFYAAILVPVNAVIVVTILAIHAPWTSRRNWRLQRIEASTTTADMRVNSLPENTNSAPTGQSHGAAWPNYLVPQLNRRPLLILFVWSVVVASAGIGSTQLKSSVGTHNMLSPNSKLIRDYSWLEAHVGPLVPIELVLRFPAAPQAASTETFNRLAAIEQLRSRVEALEEIESTLSALTFLPPLPTQRGIRNTMRRAAIGKIVTESQSQFTDLRLLYQDDQEQCWRLSGRVSGSTTKNYEHVLSKVERVIDDFRAEPAYSAIQIDVSGGIPFIYRTQQQLLTDLLRSFASAFAMIAITMAVLFRSFAAGLLLMIPNVTPAALVFGLMGWLGMEVELGTVLTASVMMGVCADDTLHLISHFRSLRQQGLSPNAAVHHALQNCGGAMIQTAIVCGVGMLAFALSPFTPVARFAWLTFALLTVGALSDLILTPAMLLSPLHNMFYRNSVKNQPATARQIATAGDGP